jgi:hypothetical protein
MGIFMSLLGTNAVAVAGPAMIIIGATDEDAKSGRTNIHIGLTTLAVGAAVLAGGIALLMTAKTTYTLSPANAARARSQLEGGALLF